MRGHAHPLRHTSPRRNPGLSPPRPTALPRSSPADPSAKWRQRRGAPPYPESPCALPGRGRQAGRPPGLPDPERLQGTGGRAARVGNDWATASRAPKLPTPTRGPLPTAPRTFRTPKPGPRPQQPHTPYLKWASQVPNAALQPEPKSPGRNRAPVTPLVPVAPPREGRLLRCAANPSPQSRGLTNARPPSARKAHLLVPSWRMGGWIFFGISPSLPAYRAR